MSLFDLIPPAPSYPAPPSFPWTVEQLNVLDAITEWYAHVDEGCFFSVTGPAGTGKTTLVREIVTRFPSALLTAMTGKAALRLQQLAERPASTLHAKLYYPPKGGEDLRFTRLRESESNLVITDEASMCTPAVFRDMQVWASSGVSFLLVGDAFQLPPVITGQELKEFGEDYSVFAHVDGGELKTVMRNAGGVLRAATRVRETGEICRQSDIDDVATKNGYEFMQVRHPTETAVEEYLADRDDHLLVTWRNAVRMTANKMIRERLGHGGPLPDEGEPVLIKKNGQGRLNGEIVICAGFEAAEPIDTMQTMWMKVLGGEKILVSFEGGGGNGREGEFFDGGQPWVENWKNYHIILRKKCLPEPLPVTWGYALTAHAAQGSQARRTTVFLCGGDDRSKHFRKPTTLPSGERTSFASRWLYTSMTRSTMRTTMIVGG
ncbi:MAG: RecD-like protein DNA helicase [Parcubacteria group bacterium GW2011_GWB1_56_8]|nr:MAG: RecD-like protein DNA helicase [Parcubacteria group bacterium GW2011_GWB1_56_8]